MCSNGEILAVLGALVAKGVRELTVLAFVGELMRRVPCSRRTAYRALRRACDEGMIRIPGY